jgi:peroxiredoxin
VSRLWLVVLRYELLLARRSRLGLTVLAVCCVAGLVAGVGAGLGPSLAAYRAWRLGSLLLGFAALPLMALAARLDDVSRASDAVEARPQPAASRLLLRFAGSLLFVLLTYAAMVAAAWLSQLIVGGKLPADSGPRFSLLAPADALAYGLVPLLFICSLAFLVTTLSPNMLAVAIVGVYWLLILVGRDFVSRIFDFSLSQNAWPYVLLSLALVLLAMQIARWRARESSLWHPRLGVPAVLLLLLGLNSAQGLVRTRHDPPFHSHPLALAMGGQSIRGGMMPGFWLPDQHGRLTGLHDLAGGPYLLGFWSPLERDSLTLLPNLQRLHERYGDRGLRVIAICLTDDWSVARRFARERGYTFPMLAEVGTHWAATVERSSPLAEAYEASSLPAICLGDRQRRVRLQINWVATGLSWAEVDKAVEALLAEPGQGGEAGG